MFRRMQQELGLPPSERVARLKSRTGRLSAQDLEYLDNYIHNQHTP